MNLNWLTSMFSKQKGLPTTGEYLPNPQGVMCPVLDVEKLDFSKAVKGHKKGLTLARPAREGEFIHETFEDGEETYGYTALEGDAVFVNNPSDQYVPLALDGSRMKFDNMEENGYRVVSMDGETALVECPPAEFLVGIVEDHICIRNTWGDEDILTNHQFLSAGATLKRDLHGKITGLDKQGFEMWEIEAQGNAGQSPTL